MYSAMIFSVASERLRLTRSESRDMAATERGIRRRGKIVSEILGKTINKTSLLRVFIESYIVALIYLFYC